MILKETTDAHNSLKSSDHDELHVIRAVSTDWADYFNNPFNKKFPV